MKRFGFLLLAAVAVFAVTACGNGKKYSISGEEPKFTASIVEEKDENGKTKPHFALNDYRLPFDSKKAAIEYFNNFKKEYESKESDGERAVFVISWMDNFDFHVASVRDGIRYVNLESEPNLAVAQESYYSTMSVDALLDEYEQKCVDMLLVMAELSDRKMSSRQERRLMQIVENLADAFDEDF